MLLVVCAALAAVGTGRAQGVLALLRRADLVVEGRVAAMAGNEERLAVTVEKIHLGPAGVRRLEIFSPKRISMHRQAAGKGRWLLFLRRLPGRRLFAPLQAGAGALDPALPGAAALRDHAARLARLRGNPAAQAAELARAAASPLAATGASATADLVAYPELARLVEPAAAQAVMERFRNLPPRRERTRLAIHLLGVMRPAGWEAAVVRMVEKREGALLAPTAGRVLAHRLGKAAVTLLVPRAAVAEGPGPLIALGATQLPEALPHLQEAMQDERRRGAAALALRLHRTW